MKGKNIMMHILQRFRLVIFFIGLSHCLSFTQDQVRVYVDAVCDLFHYGHVNFFRQARALAQELYPDKQVYLIVGLCSDADVESYKRRPIMTIEERVRSVEGCRYVDHVIPCCPLRLDEAFIKEHHIELVIHGNDWSEAMLRDYYAVPMALGIFRTVPYTPLISTTHLMKRTAQRFAELNS